MAKAKLWVQFKALLLRNLLLKWRKRENSLQEIAMPILFVCILAAIKSATTPKVLPAIPEPKVQNLINTSPPLTLYLSPDTQDVKQLAPALLAALGSSQSSDYEIFPSAQKAELAYMANKSASIAGVDFTNGLMNYTIRMTYDIIAQSYQTYSGPGQCRENDMVAGNCLAKSYLYSGFSKLQLALDTVLIQRTVPGLSNNISKPDITVKMLPKKVFSPNTLTLQILSSIYFVLAYSPFISFLLTALVYEKEKKLKEAMKMMGMRDSAFWLAWGVVYVFVIAAVTGMVVLIAWFSKFFQYSNMFILFLMLFLYGLTSVNLAFAFSPFFDKAETAGALGSLFTLVASLLYLIIIFTKANDMTGESTLPVYAQYLLCLLSPVALAACVDKGLFLDITGVGMTFDTINTGAFPLSASLIMLTVDIFLYGILAFYFDNIIPNEFGFRRKPWFFLTPTYWCPKEAHDPEQFSLIDGEVHEGTTGPASGLNANHEPIGPEFRNKNALRIFNMKKTYKTKEGKEFNAIDGLSLDIYEGQITALLGHNGAGKTTLLNMLTGMTPSTSGTATVHGLDVSDMSELSVLRTMIGFCPQHNILFDDLTPKETVSYYGAIKGVPEDRLEEEVAKSLRAVDLLEQQDTMAKQLSGGQKRKCCVAIALIGDPKVMFFDEPTAGMDPASRRHLWRLLQEQKNKVIVLTTHFMDEADILADRKAIISKGKLRCVGSSLFLKVRFGVGYHLSMALKPLAEVSAIESFVKGYIPDAACAPQHGKELLFTLPLTAVDKFPQLFGTLEGDEENPGMSEKLEIETYGISMTNLEEVFLKLGQEDEADDEGIKDGEEDPLNPSTLVTMVRREGNSPSIEFTNGVPTVSEKEIDPSRIRKQRFWALVKLRALQLLSNKPRFFFTTIFPLIYIIGGVVMLKFIPQPSQPQSQPLSISPFMYANNSASPEKPNMIYKQSATPSSASDQFVSTLRSQGLILNEYNSKTNLSDIAPRFLGVDIKQMTYNSQVLSSTLMALYNTTAVHSLPSLINLFTTTLLKMVDSSAGNISITSMPWPPRTASASGFAGGIFGFAMLIGVGLEVIPPSYGINIVRERSVKAKSQLRLSGVTSSMYWAATMSFDAIIFLAACTVTLVVIIAFQIPSMVTGGAILCLVMTFLLYTPVNMFASYAMSYMFTSFETAQSAMPNLFIWSNMLPFMLVAILDFTTTSSVSTIMHYVFCFIFPTYPISGAFFFIEKVYRNTADKSTITLGMYFAWSSNIPIIFIVAVFHMVALYYLLRVQEVRDGGGNWRDAFRCKDTEQMKTNVPEDNQDIPEDEDEDVVAERERVLQVGASAESEAIRIKNLRKEFPADQMTGKLCGGEKFSADQMIGRFCGGEKKEKVRVAVRNTSLMVEKGEVLGLLGPNGAGKTTTLNMVIAETGPTRGKVIVGGQDIQSNLSSALQAMGYCPQHDALWDEITLRQHLRCYAVLRAIRHDMIDTVIDYFLESLRIKEHADKRAKDLSGGTKRKLSYVMSMLGDPKIVLLDEPSTGMDPKSKRFLWDTITEAFNNSQRGAILTTHYMDEADALCSRVAIMVNGELECIGSTQRLKQKYGRGYQLEIKLSASSNVIEVEGKMASIKQHIAREFIGADIREIFGDRVTFNVPSSSVNSLSKTFAALEEGKNSLGIEEYSFSQATLEQVFLEFAKHQVDENEDHANHDPAVLRRSVRLRREQSIDHSSPRRGQVQAPPNKITPL